METRVEWRDNLSDQPFGLSSSLISARSFSHSSASLSFSLPDGFSPGPWPCSVALFIDQFNPMNPTTSTPLSSRGSAANACPARHKAAGPLHVVSIIISKSSNEVLLLLARADRQQHQRETPGAENE